MKIKFSKAYWAEGQMLKLIPRKLKATFMIWTSWRPFQVVDISTDLHLKATISSILFRRFRPESEQQKNVLDMTADEILNKVKMSPEFSISEKLDLLHQTGEITGQAFWFHGQLAGLTATWEFKVRLLGTKLGVQPNTPINAKSKQNRSKRSIEHRTLSDTIKEIHAKTGQRLDLQLIELAGLRDAVVHCNPQGMKAYSQAVFGKGKTENMRGNVVVISVGPKKIQNLSDLKEESEIEEQELFGWFIEVFNSGLPKKIFDRFDESIRSLDALVMFAASSFDGRERVFRNLFFEGKLPTESDIALYQQYFSLPYKPGPPDASKFIAEILNCFKRLTPQEPTKSD